MRGSLDFGRDEAPIEPGIVRDEDMPLEHAEELIANLGKTRGVSDHRRCDVRQSRDHRRNRPLRIDQRVEDGLRRSIADKDHRDLRDAVTGGSARSGGLDVDHNE